MTRASCDIAVIGAGAAGLMASLMAARQIKHKGRILVFDSNAQAGVKLSMTAQGRCNITNVRQDARFYNGSSAAFIRHVLNAFNYEKTKSFFDSIGVRIIEADLGRCFPESESAEQVRDALVQEAGRGKVEFCYGTKILQVRRANDAAESEFLLKPLQGEIFSRKLILATGGCSYPQTGSDGSGLKIAQELGCRVNEPFPALTSLVTPGGKWGFLSGLSLQTELTLFIGGKKKAFQKGALLFTHRGFSGPVILNISRYWIAAGEEGDKKIIANFAPGKTTEEIERLLKDLSYRKSHQLETLLWGPLGLPGRLVGLLIQQTQLPQKTPMGRWPSWAKKKLCHIITCCPLEVSGWEGLEHAEVTAGGVDLTQARYASMESRQIRGLYFAGEMMDADGCVGGYNLQWAWSSGAIAGLNAARSLGV